MDGIKNKLKLGRQQFRKYLEPWYNLLKQHKINVTLVSEGAKLLINDKTKCVKGVGDNKSQILLSLNNRRKNFNLVTRNTIKFTEDGPDVQIIQLIVHFNTSMLRAKLSEEEETSSKKQTEAGDNRGKEKAIK